MKKACLGLLTGLTLGACLPSTVFAYGEGEDIPYEARAIHLLTNEARMNTTRALADCGDNCKSEKGCYEKTYSPVYWQTDYYHAAQFHANMLTYAGCMQHDTPCTLKADIADLFPDKCDGDPTCACTEGVASCGSAGTKTFERVGMFAKGAGSENIATAGGGVWGTFYMWLHENGRGAGCGFSMTNGHRYNILSDGKNALGVGFTKRYAVQDFGRTSDPQPSPITAASHYKDSSGTLWFKAQFFSETDDVKGAVLGLGGHCNALERTDGSAKYGVYGIASPTIQDEKCVPYFYEIKDSSGTVTRYPTTGSLLYACDKSWTADVNDSCYANGNSDAYDIDDDSSGCSANVLASQQAPLGLAVVVLASLGLLACRRKRPIA